MVKNKIGEHQRELNRNKYETLYRMEEIIIIFILIQVTHLTLYI